MMNAAKKFALAAMLVCALTGCESGYRKFENACHVESTETLFVK